MWYSFVLWDFMVKLEWMFYERDGSHFEGSDKLASGLKILATLNFSVRETLLYSYIVRERNPSGRQKKMKVSPFISMSLVLGLGFFHCFECDGFFQFFFLGRWWGWRTDWWIGEPLKLTNGSDDGNAVKIAKQTWPTNDYSLVRLEKMMDFKWRTGTRPGHWYIMNDGSSLGMFIYQCFYSIARTS